MNCCAYLSRLVCIQQPHSNPIIKYGHASARDTRSDQPINICIDRIRFDDVIIGEYEAVRIDDIIIEEYEAVRFDDIIIGEYEAVRFDDIIIKEYEAVIDQL